MVGKATTKGMRTEKTQNCLAEHRPQTGQSYCCSLSFLFCSRERRKKLKESKKQRCWDIKVILSVKVTVLIRHYVRKPHLWKQDSEQRAKQLCNPLAKNQQNPADMTLWFRNVKLFEGQKNKNHVTHVPSKRYPLWEHGVCDPHSFLQRYLLDATWGTWVLATINHPFQSKPLHDSA